MADLCSQMSAGLLLQEEGRRFAWLENLPVTLLNISPTKSRPLLLMERKCKKNDIGGWSWGLCLVRWQDYSLNILPKKSSLPHVANQYCSVIRNAGQQVMNDKW